MTVPDVSICMVSLDCLNVVGDCLESLRASFPAVNYEIIMVDNASSDGTPEFIRAHYPEVRLARNSSNVGFSKATNRAVQMSSGRHILWLNTDTVLRRDSLFQLHRFLAKNPGAGIVGPKVLNSDGSFQPQCRRGMPTPLAALFYFTGISRVWPRNPRIGQYLMSFLPTERISEVDAISGCCLMTRRELWAEIGPLDESIFGFGEDLDWCVRARDQGWQVWYYPDAVITHLKGMGGAHSQPYRKVRGMHQAMWVFYRKHLISEYYWPVTLSVRVGIGISLLLSLIRVWLNRTYRTLFGRAV